MRNRLVEHSGKPASSSSLSDIAAAPGTSDPAPGAEGAEQRGEVPRLRGGRSALGRDPGLRGAEPPHLVTRVPGGAVLTQILCFCVSVISLWNR